MTARPPMRVLGLMSGTSADGVDVALARISGRPPRIRATLEKHITIAYPAPLRTDILRIAEGAAIAAGEISHLNFRLGEQFARSALTALRRFHISPRRIDLIGSHGQTIFHQGAPAIARAGRTLPSTLQLGEPAIIAARTGVPVVADFRPADMAVGGQGAPLVPFVDFYLYRHASRGRIALNIGGIANVTVIPRAADASGVVAFDSGPGNMVIDALIRHYSHGGMTFDRDARFALRGHLIPALLKALLRHSYFAKRPPKTAGREEFGRPFAESILHWARKHHAQPADAVHTTTVFTAATIAAAIQQLPPMSLPRCQVIVSGGGAHNPLLMAQLAALLPGTEILPAAHMAMPEDAKEAFAFAILAYESWHGRPANLPAATGAKRRAVLGKIVYPPPR